MRDFQILNDEKIGESDTRLDGFLTEAIPSSQFIIYRVVGLQK